MRIQRFIYGALMLLALSCREDGLESDATQELKITSVSVLDCDFVSRATASATYGESVVSGFEGNDELLVSYYFYDPNVMYKVSQLTSFVLNGSDWNATTPIVRPDGNTDWNTLNMAFYYNVDPASFHETDVRENGYYVKTETANGFTKYYDMLYASTALIGAGHVTVTKAATQCDVKVNMKHACALLKTAKIDMQNLEGYRIDSITARMGFYTEQDVWEDNIDICFTKNMAGDWVVIAPTQVATGEICKLRSVTFKCTNDVSPCKMTYELDDPKVLTENLCYPLNVVLYRDLVEVIFDNSIDTWTDEDLFGLYIGNDGFFEIWTGKDMHYFATMVNGGSFGCNGRVMGDLIDISAYPNWKPIGSASNPYYGIFDGNGKLLTGLKIAASITDATGDNQGLFGYVKKGTIKDFTIDASDVTGYRQVGSLVGYLNEGTVSGCTSETANKVKMYYDGGGLIGYATASTIQNCTHKGEVEGTFSGGVDLGFGGIVGRVLNATTIEGCEASGTVKHLNGGRVGGIVGRCNTDCVIDNCKATATNLVIGGESCVGGIVGYLYKSSVNNCTVTKGKIQNTKNVTGGVVGLHEGNSNIKNCKVFDCEINGGLYVGGVVGLFSCADCKILDCEVRNLTITAIGTYTGGICGYADKTNFEMNNCKAARCNIKGISWIGGCVGFVPMGNINDCTADTIRIEREGDVGSNFGGIVGVASNNGASQYCNVRRCNVSFIQLKNANRIGGIAGYMGINSTMEGCISKRCNMEGTSSLGGVVGGAQEKNVTITDCHCLNDTLKGLNNNTGGIVGVISGASSTLADCSSESLILTGNSYMGGIVGNLQNTVISNCTAEKGILEATGDKMGGVVGYASKSTMSKLKGINQQISGKTNVGGVLGFGDGLIQLTECNSEKNVITSTGNYMGGILAQVIGSDSSTVTNCYSKSDVLKTEGGAIGGIAGYVNNNACVVTNCGVEDAQIEVKGVSVIQRSIGGVGGSIGSSIFKSVYCKNTTIKASTSNYIGGLFGSYGGVASLQDCTAENVSVEGNIHVGGFIGCWTTNWINAGGTNDPVTDLKGTNMEVKGVENVGGMVGYMTTNGNDNAATYTLKKCSVECKTVIGNTKVGGVIGLAQNHSHIEDCHVTILDQIEGRSYVGGLIGQLQNFNGLRDACSFCTVTGGKVVASDNHVGGAIGQMERGTAYYCMVSTEVESTKASGLSYVGGFCGSMWSKGAVCLACGCKGSVKGHERVGGFVGYMEQKSERLVACYSLSEVSGDIDVGGLAGGISNAYLYGCYAAGNVNGTTETVGSFVGKDYGSSQVKNCVSTGNLGTDGIGLKQGTTVVANNLLSAADASLVVSTLCESSLFYTYDSKNWYPCHFWDATNKNADNALFPVWVTGYQGD